MSEAGAVRVRQWVSLPGGSCDMRIGTGVVEEASAVLKGAVGKPRAALMVCEDGVSAFLVERVRRQLTDAGFAVEQAVCPHGAPARTVEALGKLFASLGERKITADDLVLAIGGTDALSMASAACAQWCGGVPLVMVPTNMAALIEAPITPRGLDVGTREGVISCRPSVKHVLFDADHALIDKVDEDVMMARVLMVITAMCDSEPSVSRLWDRTEDICAMDREVICQQLQDTVKLRGKIVSSTALALRQSLAYGEAFARALRRLVGPTLKASTARAEALRFQARLSAGEGQFAVDDVLAQDELLDRLELPVLSAHVDPDELVATVREERFMRSNRFLLGLPRKLGRVRLSAVDDELIREHVAAWCASRDV